jgi:transcription antitermination factor NusG
MVFIRKDYAQALSLSVECGCAIDYLYNMDTKKLQIIPDKQMRDFMFLLNFREGTIRIQNTLQVRQWERVRVIAGEFTGIAGELVRIKGHKRVLVRMDGLFSVATSYIAKECLEKI